VLIADDTVGEKFTNRDFESFLVSPEEDPTCQMPRRDDLMSTPHSTSFLDLNGDCMPDIFMQRQQAIEGSYGLYHDIYLSRNVNG